jgi:3-oxoacyl-[acyl-carrier-protein] synthase-1
MKKMVNILNSHYISALGDNKEHTINTILSNHKTISSRKISAIEGTVDVPYYKLKQSTEITQKELYPLLKEIVSKSIAGLADADKKETAILVGTSIIDLNIVDAIEKTIYPYKRTEYYSQKRSIDSYAKDLCEELSLNGFTMTINSACTSSANAILEASDLIEAGLYKYVVVLGIESFSDMMSSGFYAMQLLSSSKIKPFDKQREGTILGEAIVSLLLGKEKSDWSIEGGFSNCDSVNITSVSESGTEYVNVMQKALESAKITPQQITALKAHATGTFSNDIAEINAISKLFSKDLIFTAIKPYIGHTIGACGALEIAIFMDCINAGFIPKTINHTDAIIEDYRPLNEHLNSKEGIFMFNYFGFGGNNTSLILKKS